MPLSLAKGPHVQRGEVISLSVSKMIMITQERCVERERGESVHQLTTAEAGKYAHHAVGADATFDVIDSESADGVTMYSNQPGVCTHLTLTFALPIPSRGRVTPSKKRKVVGIHTFPSHHHHTIQPTTGEDGHPRSIGQEVYTKRSDALVTHSPHPFPTLTEHRQIRRESDQAANTAGLLSSSVGHDVFCSLPQNTRQNDSSPGWNIIDSLSSWWLGIRQGAIQPGQGFLLRITRRTVSNSYSGISASGLNYIKSQRSAWGRICVAGSLASTSGVRSKAHSVGCTQSRVLLAAVPLAGLDMHEVIIKIPGASPNKQEFQFSTSRVYLQSDPFPS
ncbi:hypothetical protein V8E52_009018 [Russula decolorans]